MIRYQPVAARRMGQLAPPPAPPTLPDPDLAFTGYTGLPGALTTVGVLALASLATWAGIRTGMRETNPYFQVAGWVGGLGSALFGLLYLGAKTGIGARVGLPAVRLSPA